MATPAAYNDHNETDMHAAINDGFVCWVIKITINTQ